MLANYLDFTSMNFSVAQTADRYRVFISILAPGFPRNDPVQVQQVVIAAIAEITLAIAQFLYLFVNKFLHPVT